MKNLIPSAKSLFCVFALLMAPAIHAQLPNAIGTDLATGIVTTMAIKCRQMNISIDGAKAEVTKVMAADPRRIARIEVMLHMLPNSYTDKDKKILEHIANTCPVSLSLHPDLVQAVSFVW
jgi:putative redox protein